MGTQVSGFQTKAPGKITVKGSNGASNPTRKVTVTSPGEGGKGKR